MSLFANIKLNAKLRPLDRCDIYEDPLGELMEKHSLGSIDGGGTAMEDSGEVSYCDIGVELDDETQEGIDLFVGLLNELGLPKGSFFEILDKEDIPVGTLEGLALYVNGTELPEEVYQNCDINEVISEIEKLLADNGSMYSFWDGPEDTGLYFYGESFEIMKDLMMPFLKEYPLCEKCKIEQIA